jgi:hypothetical protein
MTTMSTVCQAIIYLFVAYLIVPIGSGLIEIHHLEMLAKRASYIEETRDSERVRAPRHHPASPWPDMYPSPHIPAWAMRDT